VVSILMLVGAVAGCSGGGDHDEGHQTSGDRGGFPCRPPCQAVAVWSQLRLFSWVTQGGTREKNVAILSQHGIVQD
jgi:hypothetical protein